MVESESLEVSSFELNAHKFDRYYCELRPSGVIVRFQIRKKLGHGAHGTVWKLEEDTGARRVRAIKVVKSRGEQTTPEVKSLIALNQYENHFTRFYGWWSDGNNLYMLTEFMAGLDLGRLIAKGPTYPTYRTEVTAQKIAKKILESVAIMHSHKIVHQDLKPGNILLADENHDRLDIRIADMGISQLAKSPSSAGTRGYTAPEVVYGDVPDTNLSEYDREHFRFSSDIWSVGCVIFATLTGMSPYPTDNLIPKDDRNNNAFRRDLLEYLEVSALGIEFIQSLVEVDWVKRPTARMALEHRWLLLVDSSGR